MELLMQLSPPYRHLIPLLSKYSSKHPILMYLQYVFFPSLNIFSLFTDFSFIGSSDSCATTADAPNKLLIELLFEQLKQIHDKELHLTLDDSAWFLQLLHTRERDGAAYSLPIPLPQSHRPARKTEGLCSLCILIKVCLFYERTLSVPTQGVPQVPI
jgi:hypothetical protein